MINKTTSLRLTRKQKDSNDKDWFKEQINSFDHSFFDVFNEENKKEKIKANYDMYNNIINPIDFKHVCKPFGDEVGELPVNFTSKDIISGKIKALLGMEMKRPFNWRVVAVNEEATSRKEQEHFSRLKTFVNNIIIGPIKEQIEMEYAEQSKGSKLTPEESERIQKEIQEKLKAQTPEEVSKYMSREHQDPAEVCSTQLLNYLIQKEDIENKFNKIWKHSCLSGRGFGYVGIVSDKLTTRVVNPLYFKYKASSDIDYIEDAEKVCYEMYMTLSEIVSTFGKEITNVQIDEIQNQFYNSIDQFNFDSEDRENTGIRVLHCEWKALKQIKFLKSIDIETGEEIEELVDETYVLNKEAGDISIESFWIPTKYEGYKIGTDVYISMREVPGQSKNLDNLYECKLSYMGAVYDNLNSEVTSIADRMKYYFYMYNVVMYRVELLIAKDEGKVMFMNSGFIPKSANLPTEQWLKFLKINKLGLMNPSEEGNKGNQDITQAIKEVDMSLVSDIKKYIELADYLERRCGECVGIPRQVEGQIGNEAAVKNTQQALSQSATLLEPYFSVHNNVKRNMLQALLEVAKVVYSNKKPTALHYVLDDMSLQMLDVDFELLENSTYGLFVSNSMKENEAIQKIEQLAQAMVHSQKIETSDMIKILRSNSVQEAEELIQQSEIQRNEREQQQQQAQQQAQAESEEKQREFRREEWSFELEKINTTAAHKKELELQKQTILSLGFNLDKDLDKDGVPDVLEVYKKGEDVKIKQSKLEIERAKLEQQKKEHLDRMNLENKKVNKK